MEAQLQERAADVLGTAGPLSSEPPVDLKALHTKIGQLTLENDFLEGGIAEHKAKIARTPGRHCKSCRFGNGSSRKPQSRICMAPVPTTTLAIGFVTPPAAHNSTPFIALPAPVVPTSCSSPAI